MPTTWLKTVNIWRAGLVCRPTLDTHTPPIAMTHNSQTCVADLPLLIARLIKPTNLHIHGFLKIVVYTRELVFDVLLVVCCSKAIGVVEDYFAGKFVDHFGMGWVRAGLPWLAWGDSE
jgi:hypothetical protein